MKKLNNKISIAGIFLFCTIVVGFVFVQTPLNLAFIPDGGGTQTTYYPYHYYMEKGYCYSGDHITNVWYVDGNDLQIRNYEYSSATIWFEFGANAKANKVLLNLDESTFWYVDVLVQYTDLSYEETLHDARTDGITIVILTDSAKTILYVKIYTYIFPGPNTYILNINRVIATT